MCVSAMLASIHVKNHLDNRNKSYNPSEASGQAFSGKRWQKSAFWKADFREKTTQWKVVEA